VRDVWCLCVRRAPTLATPKSTMPTVPRVPKRRGRLPRALLLLGCLALAWTLLLVYKAHIRTGLVESATASSPNELEALLRAARELAHHQHDGQAVLLLTFVRSGGLNEASNFLAFLKDARMLPNLLAIALDSASAALCSKHGVLAHRLPVAELLLLPNRTSFSAQPLSDSELSVARWRLLAALATSDLLVWHCDARTLWLRPYHLTLPTECDAAFAAVSPSNALAPTGAQSLRRANPASAALGISLSAYGSGASMSQWLSRMADLRAHAHAKDTADDEQLAQELSRCARVEGDQRRAEMASYCPRLCSLPSREFPNGLTTFQQPDEVAQSTTHGVGAGGSPAAIHADWPSGARYEYRLREAGLWRAGADGERRPPAERFIAFKELVINNGLSNARNALRSALAIAHVTNRTLILPPFWSRHLHGLPYRVGVDYYFDLDRLRAAFPRVAESSLLEGLFPLAASWPPKPPTRVFFIQLAEGEQLCEEVADSARLEALGNVNETCPVLRLPDSAQQLVARRARRFHLGMDEMELRAWLRPYEAEPLLLFGRAFRRFGRFATPAGEADFRRRYAAGVQPAPEIRAAASRALKALRAAAAAASGGGDRSGRFDCIHMRRRDFVADHAEEESVEQYAARAAAKLRRRGPGGAGKAAPQRPIYLASDVADRPETLAAFRKHFGRRTFTLQTVFPAEALDTFTSTRELSKMDDAARSAAFAREMRFGNVDQLLCAQAERFVGNKWSSFTHHVCYLREQRGTPKACVGSDIYGREIDKAMAYV
jgi:hypothetical protein